MAQPYLWDIARRDVIQHSKAKNFDSLLRIVADMLTAASEGDIDLNSMKMALNITGNTLFEGGSQATHDMYVRFKDLMFRIIGIVSGLQDVESVQFSIVRSYLSLGEVDEAVRCASDCPDARGRVYSAIFEKCALIGDASCATRVLKMMDDRNLQPTQEDYGLILKSFSSLSDSSFRDEFYIILSRLSEATDTVDCSALAEALLEAGKSRKLLIGESVEIGSWGLCPKTKLQLRPIDLSDSELESMLALTERLSTEVHGPGEFAAVVTPFLASLPSVILDGANIAHINQNFADGFFRFDQIEAVLAHFRKSSSKCLVVLHSKWTKEGRDLRLFENPNQRKKPKKAALPQLGDEVVTGGPSCGKCRENKKDQEDVSETAVYSPSFDIQHKVPIDLLARWRANGELLEVPHGQNDDWFWMYLCLSSIRESRMSGLKKKSAPILISNDLMRDHFWRMRNPACFAKFKRCHVCPFEIKFDEAGVNHYQFFEPPNFSTAIQTQGDIWHIPCRTNLGQISWLVLSLASQ